ncbi:MAG: AAA family ATPase [Bacteroidales bacterium]|nr:AAA family ATPase [Bacteroidales bacterium]
MENNDKLRQAATIVSETGTSLFLTGKAGTGKTTFLRKLRETSRKRMIVTAPTGIAAINAGGVTLHSFFQLDFGPFVPGVKRENNNRRLAFSKEKIKIIRGLDLLVIDEISMVRADTLDAVDEVLRRYRDRELPFGGVQLLLIGDLQQLPPVVTTPERPLLEAHYRSPYFFDSHALNQLDYVTLELTEVYRQSDSNFIDLLNAVRTNNINSQVLAALNSRYIPGFNPSDSQGYIRLTTHNNLANKINCQRMAMLQSTPYFFEAKIEGNFPEASFPADRSLELKEGAQVMFIKNDSGGDRRYFNGMLGIITSIDEDGVTVTPTGSTDQITVEPMEWENLKYVVNEKTKEITEHREGVFRQLPLRPAWAITIHKSQGLTFDRAIIDASLAFAHGQTYVALSRCRTLEGMVLERTLPATSVITDPVVADYLKTHTQELPESKMGEMISSYRLNLIEGMFNFRPLFNAVEGIVRILKENFTRVYGLQVTQLADKVEQMRLNMIAVGDKFNIQVRQLSSMPDEGISNKRLIDRVKDACKYFKGRIIELQETLSAMPTEHDNKKVRQKLEERVELYKEISQIKIALFDTFAIDDFNIEEYLDVKARGTFNTLESRKKKNKKSVSHVSSDYSESNPHPELFDELCRWRREKAQKSEVPAFTVISTQALLGVASALPFSYNELLDIPGIGETTAKRIGDEILDLVRNYVNDIHLDIAVYKKEHNTHSISKRRTDKEPNKQKTKTNQRKKGDSARESLALWNEGKSIEEIADIRQLAVTTISGHIIQVADLSDPDTKRRIIDIDTEKKLRHYYDTHPEVPYNGQERQEDIKNCTGVLPTFMQIKLIELDYPNLIRVKPEDTTEAKS